MTTINLYQNQQELQKKLSTRTANGGFIFSAGILIVTILLFVGVRIAVSMTAAQNEKLLVSIQEKNNSLVTVSDVKNVIDVQTRLEQIKSNLQIKNGAVSRLAMTLVLDRLGADLDRGIVVTSYEYDNSGKVELTFAASSYADVARQIAALKSSVNFSSIGITSISRGEKAISCGVEMYMNKS